LRGGRASVRPRLCSSWCSYCSSPQNDNEDAHAHAHAHGNEDEHQDEDQYVNEGQSPRIQPTRAASAST
jgi:hypothetical protein